MSNPYIQVHSGERVDLVNPDPDTIHLSDIAHALSNVCRFTGHTKGFYSVAQHSVLCALNVPTEHKWSALMHDAAEAYISDVSRPLKGLLADYQVIEERMERVIFKKFEVKMTREVHDVDMQALATERRDLLIQTDDEWPCLHGHLPWVATIRPATPEIARMSFWKLCWEHMPETIRLAMVPGS